jgi:putative Holliday junction resolvase
MGVLIGIDFGKKRTGLAHTDSGQIIASGLTTVATQNALSFLGDYQKETPVEKFVVGQPKQKDGNRSEVEEDILLFIGRLKKTFPTVAVVRQDERFTSKMAFNSLIQTGAKKKTRKDKAVIDEISATLILQSYLISNSKSVL